MSTLELENIKHPDNSGNNLTLAADGSIGALNLSGNMGIGTNSPLTSPEGSFSWANPIATIEGSRPTLYLNGSGSLATIRMWPSGSDGSSTALDDFHINAYATSGSTPGRLVFAAQAGAIGAGLSINSNNIVTTPDNPAFGIESSYSYSSTGTGEQVFNSSTVYYNQTNIRANVGSHWSSSTGRFTAPVAGSYSFTFNVDVKNHNSGYLLIRIRKNGSQMVGIYPDQTSAKERVTLNTILTLAAGDYMDVSWNNNYATPIFSYASFSGFLIG